MNMNYTVMPSKETSAQWLDYNINNNKKNLSTNYSTLPRTTNALVSMFFYIFEYCKSAEMLSFNCDVLVKKMFAGLFLCKNYNLHISTFTCCLDARYLF